MKRRSAARLSSNADYQTFIRAVKESQTDYIAESSLDSARDFQLEEVQAVMNDLVVLAEDPAEEVGTRAA